LANLPNSQAPEPVVFVSSEPLEKKKKTGAGAAWEKNQEPEPLEKKVRSRKKICRLPSPEIYRKFSKRGQIVILKSK